jgi:hypothetical protein
LRRLAIPLVVGALVVVGTAAGAQLDRNRELVSLDPLTRIVEGFAEGERVDGFFVEPNALGGDSVVSQFQIVANLGGGPTFGASGLELQAVGVTDGSQLNVASLAKQFEGPLDEFDLVPPLAPLWRDTDGMDLATVFEGWTAYGDAGPIEGPVKVQEPLQVIAGIELAEPFDVACESASYVGRAWVGSTVSAPDPLFTVDALSGWYGDESHAVLAERATRIIELGCAQGGSPTVQSYRMKDTGIRPFGPIGSMAFVKGNAVVLLAPIRVLDSDLTQQFFASTSEGGPIAVSDPRPAPPVSVLLPNPYGSDAVHARMVVNLDTDALGDDVPTRAETLLYTGDSPVGVVVQSGGGSGECIPSAGDLFFIDFTAATSGSVFARDLSTLSSDELAVYEKIIDVVFNYKNGASDQFKIDTSEGSFTVDVAKGGSTCTATGVVIADGLLPGEVLGEDTGGSDEAPGSDSGSTSVDEPGGEEEGNATDVGAGGVPWGPIGVAVILLGAATAYAVTRPRGRKNCDPEREAYAAADAAYDTAKKVMEYYRGEYEYFLSEYNNYRRQLENRLPEPDRRNGFPEGSAGDQAYAEAKADWDQQEAQAEIAQANIDGAREAMDVARAESEEADAAFEKAAETLRAARVALMNCQGSAPAAKDGGSSAGGGDTGSGSPGGSVPLPPKEVPKPDCLEGTTKIKIESQAEFLVLGGPVQIDVPTADWAKASNGGAIDATDLAELDESDLKELFADLDRRSPAVVTAVTVPTTVLTIKCIRIVICQGGKWFETEQTNRVEERTDGAPFTIRERSKDKKLTARMVAKAQAKVVELQANEARAASFSCD